jgi:Flp pilus assembly protein CpaB
LKRFTSARTRYLLLALAAALLAGIFVHIYLSGVARRVPVVVAARDFEAYSVLDAHLVRTVLLPASAVHPASVSRAADAVGKTSLVPRRQGEQILASSLVSGDDPGEYRAGLRPEERALCLPAEVVLGGWLGVAPGDYVDLTVVLDGVSHCLAQGLEVLEVVKDPSTPFSGGRVQAPLGVFLRVTPAQAERITLAVEYGKVYFSVLGYAGVPVPASGARLQDLYGEGEVETDVLWP